MDDNGHGTHIAGTIGAVINNGVGVSGINWNIKLMAVKVMRADGRGNTSVITTGVRYAVDNGAKIINLSLGGASPCGIQWQGAVDYANSKGTVVVVSAGNDSRDSAGYSPASCNGVITVASTTSSDSRSSFSNFGSSVEIAAPGSSILSTLPGNRYGSKSGTSMASPHIVGVAALLLATIPGITPGQVRDCLVQNADPIATDKPIGPRLNAFKSLTICTGGVLPTQAITPTSPAGSPTPTITSAPARFSISINIWTDVNNNGIFDGGDIPYQGATVNLTGPINSSGVTDASGNLTFPNLLPGNYSVRIIIPGYNIAPYPISITNGDVLLTLRLSPSASLTPVIITQPTTPTSTPAITPIITGTNPTPTPTPIITFNCVFDPNCKSGQKNLQFCPLICTPK